MIKDILLTDYKTLSPFDSTDIAADIFKTNSYILVAENNKYFGLLTVEDLIFNKKVIVGDTVKPKPILKSTDSIQKGLDKLIETKYSALPCVEEDCCIGILTKDVAFSSLFKKHISENNAVNITNIIGNDDDESIKAEFLKNFCHHTKNYFQILFSGFKLLDNDNLNIEQKDLLQSMYSATEKMNSLTSNYIEKYFLNEMIKETEKKTNLIE